MEEGGSIIPADNHETASIEKHFLCGDKNEEKGGDRNEG